MTTARAFMIVCLMASTLAACASPPSGSDAVRDQLGGAELFDVSPELVRPYLELALANEGTIELERFYGERGCVPLDEAAVVSAEVELGGVVLVERLFDCDDAGTPSVITAFAADASLEIEHAEWIASYGVGVGPDAVAERIELVGARAAIEITEPPTLDRPELPVTVFQALPTPAF